jgi:BMFP domain-containing protein YqiC
MFITKRHLSRRTFLRGAGVAVGLPLLDAMVPSLTALAQTAAKAAPRLGFVYLPHGAIMENWTPAATGAGFELSPILKPLEPFRNRLTVVSGLENKPAIAPPVHALNPGTWLSCVTPRATQEPYGGVTIDQIAAAHLGQNTPLPSLEVATEGRAGAGGACDRSFGCSYAGTLSFRTPTTPLPMEADPRKLFERLFGQGDTAQERKAISRQYSSILDLVSREAADLQKTLDAPDRAKLADYLESVREIERRVQKMEARDLSALDLPDVPVGPTFDQKLNLMFDMIALAYQANLTRVFSFMMAAEVSNITYNHIGVPDAFHPLSHHQNDRARKDKLTRIQTYHSQAFAKFLTRLAAMPDGEGTVLDNSILLYGSNMSNSNAHDEFPLPSLVVGGGAGRIKGDQHLKYADKTPLANLHLTLLERAGVPVEKVGDSTSLFSEI